MGHPARHVAPELPARDSQRGRSETGRGGAGEKMTPARELFEQEWPVLVAHAGCRDVPDDREGFVQALTTDCREWRFIGALGFGGKFWRFDGRYAVNCYPEDRTPARDAMIAKCNELLKVLPYIPPSSV